MVIVNKEVGEYVNLISMQTFGRVLYIRFYYFNLLIAYS